MKQKIKEFWNMISLFFINIWTIVKNFWNSNYKELLLMIFAIISCSIVVYGFYYSICLFVDKEVFLGLLLMFTDIFVIGEFWNLIKNKQ